MAGATDNVGLLKPGSARKRQDLSAQRVLDHAKEALRASDERILALRMLEAGLPLRLVDEMAGTIVTADEIYSLVIPRRTLSHRKETKQSLTTEETDRALRVIRITALAERVFGEHEKAARWLRKPKHRFEGRAPLEMLRTEAGARLVEEMLYQIDHGIS